MKTTACFIDTNIFYDYVNLDQIKWLDVLRAEHVIIVLPPVTFRELNDHKDGGHKPHLSGRAASTLLNLNRFFQRTPDGKPVLIREGVEIFGEWRDATVNPPLNRHINDDQLLANMLLYRTENADEQVLLITNDQGLKLKARGVGIFCAGLPGVYKTPPPQDPRDKKLKAQEDLIELLKKVSEPELDVTFGDEQREIVLKAWWEPFSTPYNDTFRTLAKITSSQHENPPPGTMKLEFQLHSVGTKVAEEIVVFINLPEGCSNWEPSNKWLGIGISLNDPWYTGTSDETDHIQYSGPRLVHELVRKIGPVYVTFPDPARLYEFHWTAHAGNMREACTGVLRVVPEPPQTPEEKAAQEKDAAQFLKEFFSNDEK